MKIYVDADACPVVAIVEQIAKEYEIPVTLLCDTNHVLYSDYSEVVTVGAGADAVDFKLVSLCHKGDIVVTQDYGGAVGTLAMVVALKSVNSSMKSIAGNAKSAQSSLTSMQASVNVVNSGLDALGSKAKSAINALISQFTNAEGKAKSSGNAVGNNFNNGVRNGMNRAVSTARSMSASTVVAMRSAGSGSYSCGVYIGAGLANGMASQVGRVRSVAAQLAAAAEAAIVAKAKIGSPSKVTHKLGGYFGEGWVNGISDRVTDAKKAAWKLVDIPDLVPVPEIGAGLRIGIEDLNDDYDYTRNETYTIYVPVEVDGRQVAKATAKYTKEEIEQQQKRDLRKKGMR